MCNLLADYEVHGNLPENSVINGIAIISLQYNAWLSLAILLQCHMHLSASKIKNSPHKLSFPDCHVGG